MYKNISANYIVNKAKTIYQSLRNIILPEYSIGLENKLVYVGISGDHTIDNVLFMTRSPGQRIRGKENHSGRVKQGVTLPGYNPKKDKLKKFIQNNYTLSKNELKRVMKYFSGGKKTEARNFLSSRRNNYF